MLPWLTAWHRSLPFLTASFGAVSQRSATDEIQPAEAAANSTSAPQPICVPTATSGNQPAAKKVVQEADEGKARFVCCGFGGKKAGSKVQR